MKETSPIVFLVDVDNTLLDNDRVQADLKRHIEREFGPQCRDRFWAIHEELFKQLGYADYLGAFQRFRIEHPYDPHLVTAANFLVDYPFANRLYPGSLDVLERFREWGQTVIVTDGDMVFQPRKVQRSVMVDDKLRILTAVKQAWGERVTTIFPRQGEFALNPVTRASYPPADVSVERISDLLDYDLSNLRSGREPEANYLRPAATAPTLN